MSTYSASSIPSPLMTGSESTLNGDRSSPSLSSSSMDTDDSEWEDSDGEDEYAFEEDGLDQQVGTPTAPPPSPSMNTVNPEPAPIVGNPESVPPVLPKRARATIANPIHGLVEGAKRGNLHISMSYSAC